MKLRSLIPVLALLFAMVARADVGNLPQAAAGSSAFCLFELPDDGGKRRWINLGIVQYLELGRNDLRIYYGGGNFGGGYEAKIPVASALDAQGLIDRIKQAAAACR